MKKIRIIAITIILILMITMLCGCASWTRFWKDVGSDVSGGLYRVVTVYSYDGKELAKLKGKIDIEEREGGIVKFELNGKRYMYYNAVVEVVEQ